MDWVLLLLYCDTLTTMTILRTSICHYCLCVVAGREMAGHETFFDKCLLVTGQWA